jgi:hypothetical protein
MFQFCLYFECVFISTSIAHRCSRRCPQSATLIASSRARYLFPPSPLPPALLTTLCFTLNGNLPFPPPPPLYLNSLFVPGSHCPGGGAGGGDPEGGAHRGGERSARLRAHRRYRRRAAQPAEGSGITKCVSVCISLSLSLSLSLTL